MLFKTSTTCFQIHPTAAKPARIYARNSQESCPVSLHRQTHRQPARPNQCISQTCVPQPQHLILELEVPKAHSPRPDSRGGTDNALCPSRSSITSGHGYQNRTEQLRAPAPGGCPLPTFSSWSPSLHPALLLLGGAWFLRALSFFVYQEKKISLTLLCLVTYFKKKKKKSTRFYWSSSVKSHCWGTLAAGCTSLHLLIAFRNKQAKFQCCSTCFAIAPQLDVIHAALEGRARVPKQPLHGTTWLYSMFVFVLISRSEEKQVDWVDKWIRALSQSELKPI